MDMNNSEGSNYHSSQIPPDETLKNFGRQKSFSTLSHRSQSKNSSFRAGIGLKNVARHTLGIILLTATLVLWTSSNFLASYIFADNSYSKPYFVTYINTAFFAFSLIPIVLKFIYRHGIVHIRVLVFNHWHGWRYGHNTVWSNSIESDEEAESLILSSHNGSLADDESALSPSISEVSVSSMDRLDLYQTAKLSLEFCLLWFTANYLIAACLKYTSVASSTILTSTSSIWTLIFGVISKVEIFSCRKLFGVLASLIGIILISIVDLSGENNDEHRGNFPHKSQSEIALGDAMAIASALLYGIYTVLMKKRIGNEDRVNMPLFFGLIGLFNLILLWPGFLVLHLSRIETFELPPTRHIWLIVLLNSTFSLVSDICWAYSMLLTSPLVVTVGLSLSIPISLVAQIFLSSQYSSGLYWVGATVVFFSFLLVSQESKNES
ncbi:putative vacuolar membrane protein [Erysiphe neolycopersici]|uniref:Putative vacuolar membrane protein n=1 Tax=Erysiphe neolycopersici TaxID=212602 RepID=A0A420HU69_9PEZI|nr:putative vacuolar membrane protein [Erysiphe neolycopersici]